MTPMYIFEFTLEGLPPMANAGARHKHWRVVQRETTQWKDRVGYAVLRNKPIMPLRRAKLTLTRFSSSQPDFDGLVSGFKSIIDGLRTHGILVDDKVQNIAQPDYRWEKAKPGEGRVRVRVESADDFTVHGDAASKLRI